MSENYHWNQREREEQHAADEEHTRKGGGLTNDDIWGFGYLNNETKEN